MALSGIPGSFGETTDITVPDIVLETDADTEVVQFIIQHLYIG